MTAVRTPSNAGRRLAGVPAEVRRREPSRPRLTVAAPPRAAGGNRVVLVVAAIGVVLAIAVVMISQTLLVGSQGRLDGVQRKIAAQEEILERQRLALAQMQSPDRVVNAATERLGMVVPDGIVYLPGNPDADALAAEPAVPTPTDAATPEADG